MNAQILAERIKELSDRKRAEAIDEIIPDCRIIRHDWPFWARPEQLPPDGDWRTWLVLAGRGFGKTRMGAEWIRAAAQANGNLRIALIGANAADVRTVMVEGESGLLAIAPPGQRPLWEPSRRRLRWRNGAQAFVYSAEEPDQLRGPQHHLAWCDELAKWAYADESWDNLQFGLRLGHAPRALVTTTPRPIALIKALMANPSVVQTRGRTQDNRANLPPSFIEHIEASYGGTRLGRQELDGELIEDVEGALWTRALIEKCRVRDRPAFRRIIVGVDPPAGIGGDACGIVVAAQGEDGTGHVIEDASVHGLHPEGWARAVAAAADRWQADRVVAEVNNGGAMVESVLRAVDPCLPVKSVRAAQGKVARAEPVASLYARDKVKHCGCFPALEDEMCGLMVGGGYAGPGRSPDRADALVWALTELMLARQMTEPAVRVV